MPMPNGLTGKASNSMSASGQTRHALAVKRCPLLPEHQTSIVLPADDPVIANRVRPHDAPVHVQLCGRVPRHVNRGFRHPRGRCFVGLSACGSTFANGEQHAAVVAGGPAWAPRHRRPKLPRSCTVRPATRAGSWRRLLRYHCRMSDYARSVDRCRAARHTYLQDPDPGGNDRHPRDTCRGRLRHSRRLRPPGIERRLSTARATSSKSSNLSPAMSAMGQKTTSEP